MNDDYYIWLLELIHADYDQPYANYQDLLRTLDNCDYRWQMVLDENRAKAGDNLRRSFAFEQGVYAEEVRKGSCSVLEVLIAIAAQINDELEGGIYIWFWKLLENLGLTKYNDIEFNGPDVVLIIERWLNRQYDEHGNGSPFPCERYTGDMRKLDIWSQKNQWIYEIYDQGANWLNENT